MKVTPITNSFEQLCLEYQGVSVSFLAGVS